MKEHLTPTLIPLALSIAVSVFLIGYVLRQGRRKSILLFFIKTQFLILVGLVGALLGLFPGFEHYRLITGLQLFALCYLGVSWLLLCLRYVESPLLTRSNIGILMILPTLSCGAVLTNDLHHMFAVSGIPSLNRLGICFYVHAVGSYLYILSGAALLANYGIKQDKPLREQAFLLLAAGLIPAGLNFPFLLRANPSESFNLAVFGFDIGSVLLLIGIYRYKLLDIVPIALRKIVDQMGEAIVVLDTANRIIEFNYAFVKIFPEMATVKTGDGVQVLIEGLRRRGFEFNRTNLDILSIAAETVSNEELYLKNTGQCFNVNIRLIRSGSDVLGRIISFNDISAYKSLLNELNKKNSELMILNRQLNEYAVTAGELAVMKERNRLARDIHDTLGQTMTVIVLLLQVCLQRCRTNPEIVLAKLEEAYQFASRGQEQARQALYGLAPMLEENWKLTDILRSLAADLRSSGIGLEYSIEGEEYPLTASSSETLYRLFQEACTNAIRHGAARTIRVKLKITAIRLMIEIDDDGKGCSTLHKGMGITGMEQRIRAINGSITFETGLERGLRIIVEIPKPIPVLT
jgi:signal transduction histidine kinase